MIGILYVIGTALRFMGADVKNEYKKEKYKAQHPGEPYYWDGRGKIYDAETNRRVFLERDSWTGSLYMCDAKTGTKYKNITASKNVIKNKELIAKGATVVPSPGFSKEREDRNSKKIGWEFCDTFSPDYDPESEYPTGRVYIRQINFSWPKENERFKYYHCKRNYYVAPYTLIDENGDEKEYVHLIRSTDGQRVTDMKRKRGWSNKKPRERYRVWSETEEELAREFDFQSIDEFVINESQKYLIPLNADFIACSICKRNSEEDDGVKLGVSIVDKAGWFIEEQTKEINMKDEDYELLKEW